MLYACPENFLYINSLFHIFYHTQAPFVTASKHNSKYETKSNEEFLIFSSFWVVGAKLQMKYEPPLSHRDDLEKDRKNNKNKHRCKISAPPKYQIYYFSSSLNLLRFLWKQINCANGLKGYRLIKLIGGAAL